MDLDNGRVRVLIDGFKPLVFETEVEFYTGEETVVHLRYEKLFGYCRGCFSMCHDSEMCPLNRGPQERGEDTREEDHKKSNLGMKSYKGAVSTGHKDGIVVNSDFDHQKDAWSKGKGKGMVSREHYRARSSLRDHGDNHKRDGRTQGESSGAGQRPTGNVSPKGLRQRFVAVAKGVNKLKTSSSEKTLPDPTRLMLEAFHGKDLLVQSKVSPTQSEEKEGQGVMVEICKTSQPVQRELLFTEDSEKVRGEEEFVGSFETGNDVSAPASGYEVSSAEVNSNDLVMVESQGLEEKFDLSEIKESLEDKDFEEEGHDVKTMAGIEKGEKKQGVKKKLFPPTTIFVGRTSKKRMVQALVSPRKVVSGKNKERGGKGSEVEEVKDTSRAGVGSDK